jgi:hypothetical protein
MEDRRATAEELDRSSLDPRFAPFIPDRGQWVAGELKKYDSYMARQDSLYRRVGVDPLLVARMPWVDEKAIPAARCGSREGSERTTLFFDEGQLRRLGIVVERGAPATDPAEVDRRLARFGFRNTACAVPAMFFAAR